MKKQNIVILTGEQIKAIRKAYGLNQMTFWSKISVTQSGGSRYESGRTIPNQVQVLLKMKYLNMSFEEALHTTLSRHDAQRSIYSGLNPEIAEKFKKILKLK